MGTKGRPCNNKIIGNSSTPSLIMFHISASLLVPRMGPSKGNKGKERGEREREKEKGRGELDEQVETWDSFERKREGGGRGTIKTHLYASQFVITILVGAGP